MNTTTPAPPPANSRILRKSLSDGAGDRRDDIMATRILIVDDERVVTEVVERYLKLEGYDAAIASDGADALKVAQDWSPHLVVLDLMLPVLDGLEV